jgi:hypothetical protein
MKKTLNFDEDTKKSIGAGLQIDNFNYDSNLSRELI